MKCEGCGEELDGIVAHAMHICSTPVITPIKNIDIVNRHFDLPMGRVMYDEVNKLLKDYHDEKS